MLNKKLTRKNIGTKKWKSKKRKHVLRGGEGGDNEATIDGTMMCPKILKEDKIVQIPKKRKPERLRLFKININLIRNEVLKNIKDLILKSENKTEAPIIQYYFIIYEFGTYCKCIFKYDHITQYNNLFKYINELNSEENKKKEEPITDEDITLKFNDLKKSYQEKYLYEHNICRYKTYKGENNNLNKDNKQAIPLYFHELFGINFNVYQSICKSNTNILKKFPDNKETKFSNDEKSQILIELKAQIGKLKQLLETIEENINKYNIIYELLDIPDIKQEPLSDDTIINNIKNDFTGKLNTFLKSVKIPNWNKMSNKEKKQAKPKLKQQIIDYMCNNFSICIP